MQKTDGNVIVTGEFVRNAKRLYRTALRYAKARDTHSKTLKKHDWEEAARHYRLLRKALTHFNHGIDPLAAKGDSK